MPRNVSGIYSKPPGTAAVANTVIESAKYNATIDDIVADLNAARPVTAGGTGATSKSDATTALEAVSYGAAQTLTAAQQAQGRSNVSAALKGHIYGLTLSNSVSDSVNDIDIAAGEAASIETNPTLIILASSLTKRLDAAWAVGTGNGGLDTGAIANSTYHVWLIQRSDTGVVDALFSLSATSPTMPASYDRKAYVGPIIRSGGTILAFVQRRDDFTLANGVADRSSTSTVASSLLALTVPTGISVEPKLSLIQEQGTVGNIQTGIASAGNTPISVTITKASAEQSCAQTLGGGIFTNTSGQIQFQVVSFGGSISSNTLTTLGWIDRRGRK